MRTIVITVIAAAALLTLRSAILAAPQQTTQYPGQMTEAHVWVQNREKGDAVGVTIQDASRDLTALRVRVVNSQNAPGFDEPIRVRAVPVPWDYQIVPVPAAANALNALTGLGSQGWEVTGGFTAANGTAMLLLKRPRP
jgi:hypothetical protein